MTDLLFSLLYAYFLDGGSMASKPSRTVKYAQYAPPLVYTGLRHD